MKEYDYKYTISFGFKDNIVIILTALLFDGLAIFMYFKNKRDVFSCFCFR